MARKWRRTEQSEYSRAPLSCGGHYTMMFSADWHETFIDEALFFVHDKGDGTL